MLQVLKDQEQNGMEDGAQRTRMMKSRAMVAVIINNTDMVLGIGVHSLGNIASSAPNR